MGRPPRILTSETIYHVSIQANRTEALHTCVDDYRMHIAFLQRAAERHELELHAWCPMTTHYHLLLTTPNADLDRAMHRLNSRYAHWFNDFHDEVGHVFRRRYTCVVVEREEHLASCYRYLALNPVKAGLVDRPEQWRWSSYGWLFGNHAWRYDPPCDTRHLLRHWGRSAEEGRRRLRKYVERALALGNTSGAWHRTSPEPTRPGGGVAARSAA